MSHTISGKLHKAPFTKQLQDSTMFAVKLSEVTKDRQTGEKVYTNYEAVLFAKTANAIQFYTDATAQGSFVVISCEKLQIKTSDCGQYTSLSMENARLENASYQQGASQAQQNAPQPQQSWGNAPQAPAQQAAPQMAAPAYNQPAPVQHAPQQTPVPQNPATQQVQYAQPQAIDDQDIPF